ncbi:periplasmic nitrate reductase, electron transfer subunit [Thalassotalea loyana]|uniref:Periplasmic nitrate reductase, electron transfer subunit n=1 Tax=Thalassotalea loyana TaxID=280483 RepID=A0ABQ6HCK1_9GAMM|nr:nitrate reductase cytochrome c-type subunit [Thalassotalea loyana]GLX84467.1 periplasmic nitrate reductase, electron transfer subunit [Thalassotalea loyana]
MRTLIKGLLIASIAFSGIAISNEKQEISTLRDETKLSEQKTPNKMFKVNNSDIKQPRNYPMQPPLIPHTIRNYEVNLNTNKCMACHSRTRTGDSQAPMVSVTHFMDRDGNFLAEISPRRYFCSQCHVTQQDAKPLVENTFVDMHQLMKAKSDPK